MRRIAVIGGGAWGTALALVAARTGTSVVLWARDPAIADAINRDHENPVYLPAIALDRAIAATTEAETALMGAEAALLVVPAQFMRGVLDRLKPLLPSGMPLLLAAKGIDIETLRTMSELAGDLVPDCPVAVLSGPSFAGEVARDLPTAVTIASRDPGLADSFSRTLGTTRFRPYRSEDPIGVELGGAVKNVLAIACGIVEGHGFGDNARAALITRGLSEMVRLGIAKSAQPETFRGLSGLGDLVLTCTAGQSRNYTLGVSLGRGMSLEGALAGRRSVVEGVATAAAVSRLAARLDVDMPITAAVEGVLHRGVVINTMIEALLSRPYRSE
ncbi:MAG: NAD(P)-dependent glycerol-3-phosphate dehydrogenase [Alphaproteobacteria bacterium]|nr:NAD(P)-dependent glycerol-3-phosphate dehydrogenase [Alphaproteobacteria bacterium]